ncbi:hypothetical protein EJ07DRAFT_159319 [Lizonia empirigonia]|nr:hypothetical protein EJ07DRAFT_159319 [Lizonia empirigonia]
MRSTLTEEQKQKIAREFNLSETTFLHEPTVGDKDGTANFDIFTPLSRLSFAGHPTIGTAIHVASHAADYPGIKQLMNLAGDIPFTHSSTTGRRHRTARVHCQRHGIQPCPSRRPNRTWTANQMHTSIKALDRMYDIQALSTTLILAWIWKGMGM